VATSGQLAKSEKSLWAFCAHSTAKVAKNVARISDLASKVGNVGHNKWALILRYKRTKRIKKGCFLCPLPTHAHTLCPTLAIFEKNH
jgi:hypothetical protein